MADTHTPYTLIRPSSSTIIFCFLSFRTLTHSTTAFNLPTAYNLPGQENISDEDDKEKVSVDPKTVDVKECTKIQVEDIVKGWIRYIKKVLKSYDQKV